MFDVGLGEIAVILVVAIIMFGPDRIPEYARQLARLIHQLRQLATSAQTELRKELGPEYADLDLTDLNPRALLQKQLREALAEEERLGAAEVAAAAAAGGALAAEETNPAIPAFDDEAT